MLKAVTAADLSRFKTQRIGAGTFGAKTIELDRFVLAPETRWLHKIPATSFAIETFTRELVRMGFLTEHGEYTGQIYNPRITPLFYPSDVFTEQGIKQILDAVAQYIGYPIAIRSDERTAKGVGAFKTIFMKYDGSKEGQNRLVEAVLEILCEQFDYVPMALKEKTGMPHGIGIMIMPLVGDEITFEGERLITPRASFSGFTVKDQNKVIVHFGYGIGGGVDIGVGRIIIDGVNKQRRWKFDANYQEYIGVFYQKHGNVVDIEKKTLHNRCLSMYQYDLNYKAEEIGRRMLEIAIGEGEDGYFEIQSMNLNEDIWAITQKSKHFWPEVNKPEGTELISIDKANGNIVGSGIIRCKGINGRITLPGDWGDKNPNEFRSLVRKGSLLLAPPVVDIGGIKLSTILDLPIFPIICNAGAIISTNTYARPIFAHLAGIFREAGIPILNPHFEFSLMNQVASAKKVLEDCKKQGIKIETDTIRRMQKELLENTELLVWADELNQTGGVVAP